MEYGSRCPDVLRVAIAGPTTKGLDEPGGQTSLCSSSCSPNAETVRFFFFFIIRFLFIHCHQNTFYL